VKVLHHTGEIQLVVHTRFGDRQPQRERGAVFAAAIDHAGAVEHVLNAGVQVGIDVLGMACTVASRHQDAHVLAQQFGEREAKHVGRCHVGLNDDAVRVDDDDAFRGRVENAVELGFAQPQVALYGAALVNFSQQLQVGVFTLGRQLAGHAKRTLQSACDEPDT
jgi:hypothetical protein